MRSHAASFVLLSVVTACGGSTGGSMVDGGSTMELVALSIAPPQPVVHLGSTQAMSAAGTYSDHSQQDLTASVTWSVTQPQVVSISPGGVLTSNKAGQSLVEAAFMGRSASATVTVPDIQPTSIQVTPSLATVFPGAAIQMRAVASFADGSSLDITRFVDWSAPPGLISITAAGLVRTPPLQLGSASISATYGPINGTTTMSLTAGPDGLYVFRSPRDTPGTPNFGNTVLVATTSPRLGVLNLSSSFDPTWTLDINLVNVAGHLTPDATFRATFAPPVPDGIGGFNQVATLRLIVGNTTTTIAQYTFNSAQVIPPAAFPNNVTFPGDAVATGKFLVGTLDDPAFFDAVGGSQFLLNATPLPRANPANFFGPNGNCLALVIEAPTVKLSTANPPAIGIWEVRRVNGSQVARTGHPFLPFFLLPPSDLAAYEQGSPDTDVSRLLSDAVARLQTSPFGLTSAQAQALANTRLPDILRVDLSVLSGTSAAYPNGRHLRDNVIASLLTASTNGTVTRDGISDDNGTRITDGQNGTSVAFPYIGRPNNPPQ